MTRGRRRARPVVLVIRWRYTLATLLVLLVIAGAALYRLEADHACRDRGGIPVRGGCAQPVLEAP